MNNERIGIASVLGLIFITLKLCGVISWSWWWVLCPFWGTLLIVIILILVGFTMILVVKVIDKSLKEPRGLKWIKV